MAEAVVVLISELLCAQRAPANGNTWLQSRTQSNIHGANAVHALQKKLNQSEHTVRVGMHSFLKKMLASCHLKSYTTGFETDSFYVFMGKIYSLVTLQFAIKSCTIGLNRL